MLKTILVVALLTAQGTEAKPEHTTGYVNDRGTVINIQKVEIIKYSLPRSIVNENYPNWPGSNLSEGDIMKKINIYSGNENSKLFGKAPKEFTMGVRIFIVGSGLLHWDEVDRSDMYSPLAINGIDLAITRAGEQLLVINLRSEAELGLLMGGEIVRRCVEKRVNKRYDCRTDIYLNDNMLHSKETVPFSVFRNVTYKYYSEYGDFAYRKLAEEESKRKESDPMWGKIW